MTETRNEQSQLLDIGEEREVVAVVVEEETKVCDSKGVPPVVVG